MQNPQHTLGRFSQPTLTGLLAQQRQVDIARTAEHRRLVASTLASSADTAPRTRTLHGLQNRLAAVRSAITQALHTRNAHGRRSEHQRRLLRLNPPRPPTAVGPPAGCPTSIHEGASPCPVCSSR